MHSKFVEWVNDPKGFGVIAVEDRPDALDHHKIVDVPGFRSAREDNPIAFGIDASTKNPAAHSAIIV